VSWKRNERATGAADAETPTEVIAGGTEVAPSAVEGAPAGFEAPVAATVPTAAPKTKSKTKSKSPKVGSPEGPLRTMRLLGLVCCLVGFVAIGLGWHGMASVACADCQLPYLLSGGATGLGLIMFGVMLLIVAQLRSDRIANHRQLERLLRALGAPEEEEAVIVEVVVDELPAGPPLSPDQPTQIVEPTPNA
jgi:hypothetical protein